MSAELTVGQLERKLSQKIQALYKEKLGHRPSQIICKLFDQKVVIVIEDSITPAEQLLVATGDDRFVEQVRSNLDEAISPYIRETIEQILEVTVEDLLSDATIETGRTAIVAVLGDTPVARNIEAIPKGKKLPKAPAPSVIDN
nr:DUF2294 domain-containing protein [Chamaesiphon polymorphus]